MAARIFDKQRGVLNTSGLTSTILDISIPNNTSVGFIAKIIAKDIDANIGAMFHQVGSISNNGGVVALDNTVALLASVLNASLATATAVFTANSTNLRLTVTGIALKNIDWQYEIEVIYN